MRLNSRSWARPVCFLVIGMVAISFLGIPAQALIFQDLYRVLVDPLRSGLVEYSGVYHGHESYCYAPPPAKTCQGSTLWVTAGYITAKPWWYRYVALSSAYLYVNGKLNHATWSDPTMNVVLSNIRLYHHTPLHGTNDDWNRVGWNDFIGGTSVYGYVQAVWDIPNRARNDVVKYDGGRFIRNMVSVPSGTSLWDAKFTWSKIVVGNAMGYTAYSGWDTEVHVGSYTWNRDWDWGCWCWRDSYQSQYNDWVIDYL